MPRQRKLVPLYLSGEDYARLARAAQEAERAPEQEARFRLKKSLEAAPIGAPSPGAGTPLLESSGDGR